MAKSTSQHCTSDQAGIFQIADKLPKHLMCSVGCRHLLISTAKKKKTKALSRRKVYYIDVKIV